MAKKAVSHLKSAICDFNEKDHCQTRDEFENELRDRHYCLRCRNTSILACKIITKGNLLSGNFHHRH